MHRILILFFLIISLSFAQTKRNVEINAFPSDFYFDFLQINDDSSNLVLLFKTTYDRLYFAKSGDEFHSGLILNIEIRDSLNFILRKGKNVKLNISDFKLTNSRDNFLESYCRFLIPNGSYNAYLTIELLNSKRVINLPPKVIVMNSNEQIYSPLCVFSDVISENEFTLTNFAGIIPFTDKKLDLFFPLNSDTLNYPVNVSIFQNNRMLFHSVIDTSDQYKLLHKNGNIILSPTLNENHFLHIKNFNAKLTEGKISIQLTSNKINKTYASEIRWISKPISLINPEDAIDQLKFIEKSETVEKLLDFDDEKYSAELYKYWKKFDNDTSNAFNDAMNEFYQRIDYTDKNFSVFDKKKGSSTDRGKIYIKYGSPDDIKRFYNKLDSVKEVWIYKNPNIKFSFVDNSGTGNYLLVNSNE